MTNFTRKKQLPNSFRIPLRSLNRCDFLRVNYLLAIFCFACLSLHSGSQAVFAETGQEQKIALISKKHELAKSLDSGRFRLQSLERDRLSKLEELEQLYAAQRLVKSGFASDISGEIHARALELKEMEKEKADLLEQMESLQFALDQINKELSVLDKEMK